MKRALRVIVPLLLHDPQRRPVLLMRHFFGRKAVSAEIFSARLSMK